MTRCPECRRPNPEANLFCSHCGAKLNFKKAPWFLKSDWWNPGFALAALGSALALSLLRVLVEEHFLEAMAGRQEPVLAAFFSLLGAALGLGLGAARRDFRRLPAWAALGVLGGLLSYQVDFFYNYQHGVYKAVWWFVYWTFPSGDNRAAETAFGLLQVLRFLGTASLLLIAGCWNQRRSAPLLKAALFLGLALVFEYHVRGAYLRWSPDLGFARQFSLYFTGAFLFIYGLDRLD